MKFLIIRLSSLGDIILTQPVVAELESRYPGAEIHYVCKPQFAELPAMMGRNVTAIPYRKSLQWHLKLRETEYHAVLDLHAKAASIIITMLCKSLRKARYNKRRRLRKSIVNHTSPASIRSTVDLYYSALRKLFNTSSESMRDPRLFVPADPGLRASVALPEHKSLLGIFPGAAHTTKKYPTDQWIEVIRLLSDTFHILLMGSQEDARDASAISSVNPEGILDLCGKLNLTQLAATMQRCDLILSGDTGPMHLAAALGIKQVAIFGATHPRLGFAPLNTNAIVLSADLQCQPCSLHGSERCPQGHFNCMRSITPEKIAQATMRLIQP
jgi:heptosyltransferase-2